jgi:hypothetical protein
MTMDRAMRSWGLTGRPVNQLPETMALCTFMVAVKVAQTKPGATNCFNAVRVDQSTLIVALEFHRNTSHHRPLKKQMQFRSKTSMQLLGNRWLRCLSDP